MPGRHINDHQKRLFMKHRQNDGVAVAAAKAGLSAATGYRLEKARSARTCQHFCVRGVHHFARTGQLLVAPG